MLTQQIAMAHHFITTPHENGHSARICAFFDDEHLVARGAKGDLPNYARFTEFLRSEILESRHDTTLGCNRNELGGRDGHILKRVTTGRIN